MAQSRGWDTSSRFRMNSIYSKIAGLLIVFNISLLGLFFLFDDYIPSEVSKKKDDLTLKANLFAKIVKPVLLDENISHFEKTIRIENLLDDNKLYQHRQMRIYRFDGSERLSDYFVYFDGEEKQRLDNLKINSAIGRNKEKTMIEKMTGGWRQGFLIFFNRCSMQE